MAVGGSAEGAAVAGAAVGELEDEQVAPRAVGALKAREHEPAHAVGHGHREVGGGEVAIGECPVAAGGELEAGVGREVIADRGRRVAGGPRGRAR